MAQAAALTQLRTAVRYMLKDGHSHADISEHVRIKVMKVAKELPSRKVLYSKCYGGFSFSPRFERVLAAKGIKDKEPECREDPKVLEAILQFGEDLCTEFPFVHDAITTNQALGLQQLMKDVHSYQFKLKHGDPAKDPRTGTEEGSLAERAMAFYLAGAGKKHWHVMISGNMFRSDRNGDLWQLLREPRDELWMLHRGFMATEQAGGLLLADHLLKDSPGLRPEGNATSDADAFKYVGFVAASGECAALEVQEVPAVVEYTIHEYDGMESVCW